MRDERFARQWSILRLLDLHREGLRTGDIAERLATYPRAVRRDLEVLAQRFPIYDERVGREVRWRLQEGFRLGTSLPLDAEELAALYLSQSLLSAWLRGTPLDAAADRVRRRIEAAVAPEVAALLDRISGHLLVKPGSTMELARGGDVLSAINAALSDGRTVELTYFSNERGERTHRRVDPYGCIYGDGIYLVGRCHVRDGVRVFAVPRIEEIIVTDETFVRDADFDLETYAEQAFGVRRGAPMEVRVRVRPPLARYVAERRWHPSQTVQWEQDGAVVVQMEAAGLEEVARWVLSLGAAAEVLAPAELVQTVLSEARALVRGHS